MRCSKRDGQRRVWMHIKTQADGTSRGYDSMVKGKTCLGAHTLTLLMRCMLRATWGAEQLHRQHHGAASGAHR